LCCRSLIPVVRAVTSVNIAIPSLQRRLDVGATELLWIIDIFALVFADTLLLAGALGNRFGRKDALVCGLGLCGAGALFAGVFTSSGQVIGPGAVMGVAPRFVMPATLSIITTVLPSADARPLTAAPTKPTARRH
jgi:MFS transporter, DHA2 family, multidrug resistance protein